MNSNPLRYQGVVRNDEDDISVTREEEQPNIKSTSINSNGEKAASTIGLINAYSGTIVAILCIIILALVANINKNIANSTYSYSTGGRATLVDVGSLHAIGSTASPLQLYRSETPDALYCRIAQSLVDTNAPMMMYEQLTSGIGVRELYWDAGTIISSDIVRFQKGESTKLQLITVQQGYRGDPSVVQRSFSDPVIWAFDILDVNLDGFLIDMSEFALASIGHIHNNDLSVVIAAAFGQRYVYAVDVERSFIDTLSSDANAYRMKMGRNITYVLSSAIPPPAPLGKTISLSSRRSFVLLDQYHSASTAASSSRTGESNHMRSIAGTISGAKLPAIGTTVPEYTPRPYHPMSGFNSITFMNESSGLLEARHESFLVRHFLVQSEDTAPQGETNTKTSPTHHTRDQVVSAEATAPFTQIVYYVDEDTPPGIREALVEGISWWDEAFQYAGYPKDTFIVQTTNRDQFDPYDVSVPRRSFVEWMDRNLRAYSLGIRLQDARSGEILKGHVRIENLRVRQDALIAEALLGPFYEGAGAKSVVAAVESQVTIMQHLEQRLCKTNPVSIDSFGESETADPSVAATSLTTSPVVESILAAITQRVKQLGAHEVGHTLGLAHNFAGSSYSQGYASVMDYPPPIVTIDPTGTKLVLNEKSYGNRIGIFDKVAIDYGYRRLDANLTWAEQRAVLDDIIQNAVQKGYVFLTDQDTAAFGQDWRDTQWDSGTDPVRALNHSLQVRALALQKLTSSSVLPAHAPLSNLQELFPIVYLWHRYEVEAVAKLVGGSTFQYEMKEDIKSAGEMHPVPPAMQAVAITQVSYPSYGEFYFFVTVAHVDAGT